MTPTRDEVEAVEDDRGSREITDRLPFEGRLTEAMHATVHAEVERRLGDVADPEDLMQRVENLRRDDVITAAAQPLYSALQKGLPQLLDDLDGQERALERAMAEIWGPADGIYKAVTYIAYELGGTIATARQQHTPKLYALLGAHGRAVRTAAEVRHLAMGGFGAGATARWRSLHDLAVLCLVLHGAAPEISERYLAYSRVELWKDIQHYQKHAAALGRRPFTAGEQEAARAAADQVVERWGTQMRKPHGWAMPLFPGRAKVDFVDLDALAGLTHLRPFYRLGNHHVHAGPRAAELNMRSPEAGAGGSITTGPTVFADIAGTCHGAAISLNQATSALVTACLAERLGAEVDLLLGLQAQARFVDDAGAAYSAAADQARSRGWFTHSATD